MGRPRGSKSHNNDNLFKYCAHRSQWNKCVHGWYMRVCYDGVSHQKSVNKFAGKPRGYRMSKTDAQKHLLEFIRRIHAGSVNVAATPNSDGKLLLRDVCDKHLEAWGADPTRRAHRVPIRKQGLDVICSTEIDGRPFGSKAFDAIVTADLEKFRNARRAKFRVEEAKLKERRAKIAAGDADAKKLPVPSELPHARHGEIGIKRSLELLRHVFTWAIQHGYRNSESPFRKFGQSCFKLKKEEGRERRLREGEEERLLKYAAPHLRVLIVAALETGMRREEILSLQWKDIQLTHNKQPRAVRLRAENTKTARPRTIPITQPLRTLLEMRRNDADGEPFGPDAYVFGNEVGERQDSIKTAWRTTCQKARITDLHFHDLRHEAASRWLDDGIALLQVQHLLGHRSIATTSRYANASPTSAENSLHDWDRRRTLRLRPAKARVRSKGRAEARVH